MWAFAIVCVVWMLYPQRVHSSLANALSGECDMIGNSLGMSDMMDDLKANSWLRKYDPDPETQLRPWHLPDASDLNKLADERNRDNQQAYGTCLAKMTDILLREFPRGQRV
jgi:hypothetical protein